MTNPRKYQFALGPDGERMTVDNVLDILPPPGFGTNGPGRWTPGRKNAVIQAIKVGLITRELACQRWNFTDQELKAWERNRRRHGVDGLKVTRLQKLEQEYEQQRSR